MSVDRESVPVSLPKKLVEDLDRLVDEGRFSSRSEALRRGARVVTEKEKVDRLHELSSKLGKEKVEQRLSRKNVP